MISVPSRPYPYELDPGHTALVVIDMQRDFIERGGFGDSLGNDVARLEAIIPTTAALIGLFRAAGLAGDPHARGAQAGPQRLSAIEDPARQSRASISARPAPWGGCWWRASRATRSSTALAPVDGEIVIDKPGKGMFWATGLHERLQGLGITHLVFAGVTTEVCVQTSMREANDRGYECLLIEDATESYFAEFKAATLEMIAAQGGIVGWVTPLAALQAAVNGVMIINDPAVLAEVEAVFARYEAALVSNDVAVLDELFLDSPMTIRYGIGENLYGIEAIREFRLSRPSAGLSRRLDADGDHHLWARRRYGLDAVLP